LLNITVFLWRKQDENLKKFFSGWWQKTRLDNFDFFGYIKLEDFTNSGGGK
jgi:hypothetical protein